MGRCALREVLHEMNLKRGMLSDGSSHPQAPGSFPWHFKSSTQIRSGALVLAWLICVRARHHEL